MRRLLNPRTSETAERQITRLSAEADFLASVARQAEEAGLHKIANDSLSKYAQCTKQIVEIRTRLEDLNARVEIDERRRRRESKDGTRGR